MMVVSSSTKQLVAAAIVAILALVMVERFGTDVVEHPAAARMRLASGRAERYLDILDGELASRGVVNEYPQIPRGRILGREFSEITTTLGSFEAKLLSLHPEIAAMIVRIFSENGIDSGATVGVALSGSFPGAAISVFAALETLGMKAEVISSLGASTFGANRPEYTWADLELILSEEAGLSFRSAFVTPGGESDNGGGIPPEGMEAIRRSVQRTGRRLVVSETLEESISSRVTWYRERKIAILVNVGGNQAMLGGCVHAVSIPNGYLQNVPACSHEDRGAITRLGEEGIPVVHVLHLKGLAEQYGGGNSRMYEVGRRDRLVAAMALLLVGAFLLAISAGRIRRDRLSR